MEHKRLVILLALCLSLLSACATVESGDDTYRPRVGQHGKDIMWIPTLDVLVMPMLEAARVTPDDLVYDLGSGDGKIPIWAARHFGARAVGIEYNADLAALGKRNAERAGVSDRVRMIHGDIFKEDFSSATVLTLFLGRDLNLRLKPIIARMRPGTRVVSNAFDMGLWEPDQVILIPEQNPVYFWVVPARVEGEWEVSGLSGSTPATLGIVQRFQKLEGTLTIPGRAPAPVKGRLDGASMSLEYEDQNGSLRRIASDVNGAAFSGHLTAGGSNAIAGRKRR